MKICHVITRLILGGAQENTILTCEGLAQRGHQVTLVTGPAIGPEGQLFSRARQGGYGVMVVDAMRRAINPLSDFAAYQQIKHLLADISPDIVHTHSSKAGIIARRAAATLGGIKIVHTIHGLPFHPYQSALTNRFYIALEQSAARRTDAIISVADAMTEQALAAGVGRPQQYTTIYSGMEVDKFLNRPPQADEFRASLNLPADAVLFTQVSRLAELKGHEFIIEAARRVKSKRAHYCFIGDGHWRRRIEKQIIRSGLADRFRIIGLLPPEMMPAVMHATDVLLHCSLREGLARTLPQAIIAGKPVISFDVDGAREVVNSYTGALLEPRDIGALGEAVDKLAVLTKPHEELSQMDRQHCAEMFDWRRMVEQIEALYQKFL